MVKFVRLRDGASRGCMVAILAGAALGVRPVVSAPQPPNPVNATAAAHKDFEDRLNKYLELRSELAGTVKPLSSTDDPRKLSLQQEQLAAALRDARQGARQGDLIPAPVAEQIRQAIAQDFKARTSSEKRGVFEEVPVGVTPMINRTYPQGAALPTLPPLLLMKLPKLPDNLQYRYVARHVVLLDGDAHIIVDYIPNVLPPH